MPGTPVSSFDNSGEVGGTRRNELIQFNNAGADIAAFMGAFLDANVLAWQGVGPNTGTAPLFRASTDTTVGTANVTFTILGVPVNKTVSDAGTALTQTDVIVAGQWGIFAIDVVAAGTVSSLGGANNASPSYATEAAAIAALPVRIATKARLGYITVQAAAAHTWTAGTDALAGGSSGTPAQTTNYYPVVGICGPTGTGVINGVNGLRISPLLAIGSNDYEISWTAFTYNANGLANIAKAASTTGTAIGALGVCPADKCFGVIMIIDGAGTVTYKAVGGSCAYGYNSEGAALADALLMTVANKCIFGIVTGKTKSALTWTAGTDAFAGGSTGNAASSTHYWGPDGVLSTLNPTPASSSGSSGVTLGAGQSSAQIANMQGKVITA